MESPNAGETPAPERSGTRAGRASPSLVPLRVVLDLAAIAAAAGLAFWLRFGLGVLGLKDAPFDPAAHGAATLLWGAGVIGGMASARLYDEDTLFPGSGELARIRGALIQGVALVAAAVFLLQLFSVSRGWFLLVVLGSLVLLSAERLAVRAAIRRWRARGRLRRPAILLSGDPAILASVPQELAEFDVVERITPHDLPATLSRHRGAVPVVVIDGEGIAHDEFWRLVMTAGEAGASVFVRSPVRAVRPDRLTTRELEGETIMKVSPPGLVGFRAFAKRGFDVVVSLVLLVLLALPMAILATAIAVTSGRPVFYGQTRVGKGGRPFTMWKFRTMRPDAEEGTGPVWAERGDPRRTGVGRLLRRFSLDELPQLWNVLRGDMSLVGPRPERPLFVTRFSDDNAWYRFRHRARPGITGLAQVRGLRGDTPLEPRIASDNWYIEHWSLTLDARILVWTIAEVLRGRNAA